MEMIDALNDLLIEKDESKISSALINFLSSLSPSDLSMVLFPTNILRYEKLATGKAERFQISDEAIIDSKKDTVLYLLGVEIASRSIKHGINLPPAIVESLTRCGIEWLKYSFVGATSEMFGTSWSSFLGCVLPAYVLSIDGKPHDFTAASGNTRTMRQGWVRRGDLIRDVATSDKKGSFTQLQAVNAQFFRLHPEIDFKVVSGLSS